MPNNQKKKKNNHLNFLKNKNHVQLSKKKKRKKKQKTKNKTKQNSMPQLQEIKRKRGGKMGEKGEQMPDKEKGC